MRLTLTILIVIKMLMSVSAEDYMSAVTNSHIHLNTGTVIDYRDFHDNDVSDFGVLWGFGDLSFLSGEFYGVQLGADIIVPVKLWEDHADAYKTIFEKDYVLKEIFLNYNLPTAKTKITIGRNVFDKSPVMDGDSHQGAQLKIEDIEFFSFNFSGIYRWIDHADPYSMSGQGITEWEDVDDIENSSGDVFYSAFINIDVIPDYIVFNPFVSYQDDVMIAPGASWKCSYSLNTDWSVEFDGVYSRFINQFPESEFPDYEDINVMLLHTSVRHKSGSSLGIGWYDLGSGNLNSSAGMFNLFDPMDRDDFIGYDDRNDTSMYYMSCKVKTENFDVYGLISHGRNRPNETDFFEFDFWAYYKLTTISKIGFYYVYTDYSTDLIADYARYGMTFTIKFL
jgi:hypothetical protein